MNSNLKIRPNWFKAMYLYSVVGGGGFGLMMLLNVGPMASTDSFVSATLGCYALGFAVVALLGVRQPLKFVPLLAMQLVYKTIWFAFVFFPALFAGHAPSYASVMAIIYATFIVGDLITIPFLWLFQDIPVQG